ncbi:MAG: ankyrin repeat domain-containing protein [Janthinobacterium lividum]
MKSRTVALNKTTTLLFQLIQVGNLPGIKKLSNIISSIINLPDDNGTTPLLSAIYYQNNELVKFLCEQFRDTINVNQLGYLKSTTGTISSLISPLMRAIYQGDLLIAKTLLGFSAVLAKTDQRIFKENNPDNTFLLDAISKENLELVKFFVQDIKVDINEIGYCDQMWISPIMRAVYQNNEPIAEFLLDQSDIKLDNIAQTNIDGADYTLLERVTYQENFELYALILERKHEIYSPELGGESGNADCMNLA